jgi:hypothetical protein
LSAVDVDGLLNQPDRLTGAAGTTDGNLAGEAQ